MGSCADLWLSRDMINGRRNQEEHMERIMNGYNDTRMFYVSVVVRKSHGCEILYAIALPPDLE